MLTTVEAAFVAALASATTWPVRWPNNAWPDTVTNLSDGNMPLDDHGRPAPAIEAEIIAGKPETLAIGKGSDGKRTQRMDGILRLYLSVGLGTGRTAIVAQADALRDAFTRLTLVDNPADGERLVTEDARIDDGIAPYEEGNRFDRTVTVPFTYLFKTAQK
jgi:hypothetical protein